MRVWVVKGTGAIYIQTALAECRNNRGAHKGKSLLFAESCYELDKWVSGVFFLS